MAEEELQVQDSSSGTFYQVHRDGNYFANDGRAGITVYNELANDLKVTVTAVTPCSQGFIHDGPTPGGLAAPLVIASNEYGFIDPVDLDPYRFNDAAGYTHLTYTDYQDNQLPDDGGGHPNNVSIIVRRVL
jgi:hypothetical protein